MSIRAIAMTMLMAVSLSSAHAASELLLTQYRHHSWTSNDGLPQDSVNDIAQTPDGYLWIATQEGLARFDGVGFTLFDSRTTNGAVPNFIYTLFVDRAGTLWIGGGDGLVRYVGNGQFKKHGPAQGWPGVSAKFISQDAAGDLWIGMGTESPNEGRGMVRFSKGDARLYTTADGLTTNQVYQIAPAPDGSLWIGTRKGLNVFREGRFSSLGTSDGLPDDIVRAVMFDRQQSLWVGTPRGLARLRDGRVTDIFTTRDGLPDDHIRSLHQDRDGALWIATLRGLARFQNGKFETAAGIPGLADDATFTIFEDRERNLWIGTHTLGLHRLRRARFKPFGPPEGLVGQSVHAIAEDRAGRVWVGTDPGGVSVLDGARFASVESLAGGGGSRALLHARDGSIWAAGRHGLGRVRGAAVSKFTVESGLPRNQVRALYQDRDGAIFAGTDEGLARFDGARFEKVALPESAPHAINVIHRAGDGKLWVGGGDGVGYLVGEAFTPLLDEELPDANVYALHEDDRGSIWLTTWDQGLYRIRGQQVSRILSTQGMYDDVAWSIVDDGIGSFWFGSNRGIFRVTQRELNAVAERRAKKVTYTLFGTSDGMRKRETNAGAPSAIRASDGTLWFATTAGVVQIDPRHRALPAVAPNVVIERFISNDKIVEESSPSLAPGNRNVAIHYVASVLGAPERVRYKYRLEGYDEQWVEAGNRRDAFYTNVDPGKYRFRVMAASEDGVWSEPGAAIEFELRPYFYQRPWFAPLAAVVIFLCGVIIKTLLERHRTIRHQVNHDSLTGLPNRRLLAARGASAIARATARGRSIALLFLDLDGFKQINDQFGHDTGDQALQIVARRLRASLAEIDTLARIGGDEFVVLIPDLDDESRAAALARRLVDALHEPIPVDGAHRLKLAVSIGIALHPFDGGDIRTMLQAADRAMYRVKLTGGNAYEFNAANAEESVSLLV